MLEPPENYQENFEKVNPKTLKVGDYVLYLTKERPKYSKNKDEPKEIYPSRWCQGYLSLVPDEELGFERWGEDYKNIFGCIHRGKTWSFNLKNVKEIWKSKLDPKTFRERGARLSKKPTNPESEPNQESEAGPSEPRPKRKYTKKNKITT